MTPRAVKRVVLGIVAAVGLGSGMLLAVQFLHDPGSGQRAAPGADPARQIARGAYLARAGDCMACHTVRGGAPYAGGRAIATPFGTLYSPNITPHAATGIGGWDADDFWRALHNGKSKSGQFLYPAFPYTEYTRVTRADSDALYAYLRTVPGVAQAARPHALRFPYNQRVLLAAWRALYFRPGAYRPDPGRSPQWNRGAYLTQGLGHCAACHSHRNGLGATAAESGLGGGLVQSLDWYAPSLSVDAEAGLGTWAQQDIIDLLHTGVSSRGAVFGPMAEVVRQSLQYLTDDDIAAVATYLKAPAQPGAVRDFLPVTSAAAAAVRVDTVREEVLHQGAVLYRNQCADCHRSDGTGLPTAYPPLAGNRAVTMASPVNAIRMVVNGGFPPSTSGNPRPYGMPPFGPVLGDDEIAAVVSYVRNAWGNQASVVSAQQVRQHRAAPAE